MSKRAWMCQCTRFRKDSTSSSAVALLGSRRSSTPSSTLGSGGRRLEESYANQLRDIVTRGM